MTIAVSNEPVTFADLPGWADDDHLAAFKAFCASAAATGGPAARRALDQAAGITTAAQARAFFEAHFRPARILHDGPRGLLTGYYEPIIEGSLQPSGSFTVPIYKRPADLENVVSEAERGAKGGALTHVRRTVDGVTPYATRADIEAGALTGQNLELCYLADAVDAFFLHVQGSGVIRLADGGQMRITYDGKNGHPYTSIGRTLIDEGAMTADGLTLQVLGDYLRADPARGRGVMQRNASFVFFKELLSDSAAGVLGTPLVRGRSLAVDTAFHALGAPIYVSAPAMTHVKALSLASAAAVRAAGSQAPDGFHRLMITHDVGSAIKGPERGDIYFGTGDAALALAGITKHPGSFFVLLPVDAP